MQYLPRNFTFFFIVTAYEQACHRTWCSHCSLLWETGNSASSWISGIPSSTAGHTEGGPDQHGASWIAEGVGLKYFLVSHGLLDFPENSMFFIYSSKTEFVSCVCFVSTIEGLYERSLSCIFKLMRKGAIFFVCVQVTFISPSIKNITKSYPTTKNWRCTH